MDKLFSHLGYENELHMRSIGIDRNRSMDQMRLKVTCKHNVDVLTKTTQFLFLYACLIILIIIVDRNANKTKQ